MVDDGEEQHGLKTKNWKNLAQTSPDEQTVMQPI